MNAYQRIFILKFMLPCLVSAAGLSDLEDILQRSRLNTAVRRNFPGSNAEECGKGWVLYGDSCYKYGDEMLDWDSAQRSCYSVNAHLAEVRSTKENDFLLKLWEYSGTKEEAPWLGATDQTKEGEWHWASGLPFNFQFWADIYGEPNGGTAENCLNMHYRSRTGRWNDAPCSQEHAYICQKFVKYTS